MRNHFTKLEINTILQLKINGLNNKEIAKEINKKFNTNRTAQVISYKLYNSFSRRQPKKNCNITKQDELLISYIKQYPTNIKHAITIASKKMNIGFHTLNNRYYQHLKHNTTILTVGSEIGFSNNIKNALRDIDGNLSNPDMNDVQWLMKQILNLSEEKRKTIKLLLTD